MGDFYHGRNAKLIAGFETAYKTPAVSPVGTDLRFNKFTANRNPDREEDASVGQGVLMDKRDEVDEEPKGTIESILCLNTIGWWLKLLLGAPVTTGAGPYVHTFTMSLNPVLSAWFELQLTKISGTRYQRYLGGLLNTMDIDAFAKQSNWNGDLIFGQELLPKPTAALAASPTAFAKARACKKKGIVYDVSGANTLGIITGFKFKIEMDLDPQMVMDATAGYSDVLIGQPKISGSIKGLFTEAMFVDHARAGVTDRMQCVLGTNGAETLALNVPATEYDEPAMAIETSKGLAVETNWRGHGGTGIAAPTLVLTNSIASYL